MNGFFEHKDIHKYTWHQETKQLKSIIDYIVIKQNTKFKVDDVRVYRGAECGSDHFLVVSKLKILYRNNKSNGGNAEDTTEKVKTTRYKMYPV